MPELPPPPEPAPPPAAASGGERLRLLLGDRPPVHARWWTAAAALAVVAVAAFLLLRPGPGPPVEVHLPRAGEAAGAAGAAAEPLQVHAAGAVTRPGLYQLPGGSRVADVIAAAGGAAPDADLDHINLAARVGDGERIYVPRKGEVAAPAAGPAPAGGGAPLDLNTATAEQLDALPGIGPALADAIVRHRQERGRFRSVDDLLQVAGIGETRLERLRPLVRV